MHEIMEKRRDLKDTILEGEADIGRRKKSNRAFNDGIQ